nr:SUMF1/EgtB/PvdO family nonheme iron enzyme [Fimbriiglobus ruber]
MWFTLEVIANGDRIETRVDGKEAVVYVDSQRAFARGRFAIQALTPETIIRARKIEVRRLPTTALAAPRTEGPLPAIAPFSATQARAYQREWSAYLGVEPEVTNSIGMKFRLIPPGEFQMGTPPEELRTVIEEARSGAALKHEVTGLEREWPPHEVRLTQPYYLGTHEVTYGQYRAFVRATGYKTEVEKNGLGGWSTYRTDWVRRPAHVWSKPGEWQPGDDEPVVQMNWSDAHAFCTWLSSVEGRSYVLPTEAQWEFACRAGAYGLYGACDLGDLQDYAWIRENQRGPDTHRPHPVGLKRPNAFGLYDMLGNVWEHCADWYSVAPVGSASRTDPTGPAMGTAKVLRGGGWHRSGEVFARCSVRERTLNESGTDAGTGFRIAIVGELKTLRLAPAPRLVAPPPQPTP